MAGLFDSLVSQFDLCVNAICYTEAGYTTVRKAASSQPLGVETVSVSGVMNQEDGTTKKAAISEENARKCLTFSEKRLNKSTTW
jgi:hypothetical protein